MSSSTSSLFCRRPFCSSPFSSHRRQPPIMPSACSSAAAPAASTCSASHNSHQFHLVTAATPSSPRSYCSYLDFSRSSSSASFPDLASSPLLPPAGDTDEDADEVWSVLRREAELDAADEPVLSSFYESTVLSHSSLEFSLASLLASKLCSPSVPAGALSQLFLDVFAADPEIGRSIRSDLCAARDRDPACSRMVHCFLYYKGFLALQAHRVAHRLWVDGRKALALFMQGRVSEVFAVDVHPGARIGAGILLDHATGLVIGETAVVGDNVSILHNVTLGGTGKESGDRHPKIGDGVLVGAGTQILGNVRVGEGAKVGAGSVVLKDVPARTTAVGNPAKLLGGKENPIKLDRMPSFTMDHTSWSDYVI